MHWSGRWSGSRKPRTMSADHSASSSCLCECRQLFLWCKKVDRPSYSRGGRYSRSHRTTASESCLQESRNENSADVQSSGSLVDPLNTYLNSFCASSTATCSNDTLRAANSSIASGCSSDIQAGGTDGATVAALQSILQFYPQVKTAGCARNST
jgi:hypothetical protein